VNDAGVLVVGYGNRLRGDDGFGCYAAGLLAADPRLEGATVLARHQLTPELATDIASASLVVMVDASVADGALGSVAVRFIQPRRGSPLSWSHHLDPAALAGLADALYGYVPPMVLISVAGAVFADTDRLSPALQRVLLEVVDRVAQVVEEYGPRG
jgi:hydrogenase maturation protease